MAQKKNKKLQRGLYFTDIHFGKKGNSETHNQDCLSFIDWFTGKVKDYEPDYIGFLGDWHEQRSSLNIATLKYSYYGAKKINALGLPTFFCIGNHDLFHRHTREIYSVVPFNEFSNFQVIDQPTLVTDRFGEDVLFSPYLFHDEYGEDLKKYLGVKYWAGHFEFKGFQITGYNMVMPTGPDPTEFAGPKDIVSGHFHKRQTGGNITYMGNTFPMDFGDAGDADRGLMVYDHGTSEMIFENWDDCPKYLNVRLSDLLDKKVKPLPNSRVKCVIDMPISYEENSSLKEQTMAEYGLRDIVFEESREIMAALTDTETVDPNAVDLSDGVLDMSIDDLIIRMLKDISSDHIDNDLLIEQYRKIQS